MLCWKICHFDEMVHEQKSVIINLLISRAVPNIRFEFEPVQIVRRIDYLYSAEQWIRKEPEYES